jgi:putative DNA primase/helicase
MSNIISTFSQAMQNKGIEPPPALIADGILHRFTVSGDKARSDNGWYCLHPDEPPAGAFGCWKRDINEKWAGKSTQALTAAERTAYTTKLATMQRQHDEAQQVVHAECVKKSAELLNLGHDVEATHPYIQAKQIIPVGAKQLRGNLLISVNDSAGNLRGLQVIGPDGSKRFKTGTAVKGNYLLMGSVNGRVNIAEGWATGCTIHQLTGEAVVMAYNCNNLLPVAKAIRAKYPDAVVVLCADDDYATPGNPGLSDATKAAQAVNGLLAVPIFSTDRGQTDTDFNDMARLSGPDAVRTCIEQAAPAAPAPESMSLDEAIQRLSALSPLEYDRIRKEEAKALRVRPSTLDEVVKSARKGADNTGLPFIEVEPWPSPIHPAELLSDIAATVRRFIICSQEIANAVALWITMTWFIDVIQVAPLAVITAPEMRCGKSLLLNILGRLSARSITASNITASALFRAIDKWNPTLLIDEVDALLKENEELRGLLNSGHTRDSAFVIRNVSVGDNFTPTRFSTWGAKALAGIGDVKPTLQDRAVILKLRRKLPHENVERIRHAEPALFSELRSKLARFGEDYSEQVRDARPPLPDSLNDRAQDNWESLLAIAMVASPEWLRIGTQSALKLSGEATSPSIGIELLSSIQTIFADRQDGHISTVEMIKELCADAEKPWRAYNKGQAINPKQVAGILRGFTIKSKPIRFGAYEVTKGYELSQFTDAFSRYIPSTPIFAVIELQPTPVLNKDVILDGLQNSSELPINTLEPLPVLDCNLVTDNYPPTETSQYIVADKTGFAMRI